MLSRSLKNILKESFWMAIDAIRQNKLRSILTLLGISIGVFSVIGVMTAIRTLESSVESGLNVFAANTFVIQKYPSIQIGRRDKKIRNRKNIDYDQFKKLKDRATFPVLVSVSEGSSVRNVKYKDKVVKNYVELFGGDEGSLRIFKTYISDGRNIAPDDVRYARNVCVLGMDVEDDFLTWVAIGTALGTGQRLVQNSKKIPLGSKEKYLKLFHSHALQFTFQKLREWTAGTTVTKLASFGGTTEKIGRLLLPQIDDPMASKSVLTQANSMENYFMRKASNLIKNSTPEERGLAISINRGNSDLEKTASSKVLKLADDLNGWMSELKVLYNKAGFYSPKELDNYFPRVLNWEAINAERTKAIDIFTDIFEQNYKISTAEAKKRATKYIERNEGVGNISVFNAN